MSTLVQHVRNSIIGDRQRIGTPFGDKPLVYADYVASGRSLSFIEDFIRERYYPITVIHIPRLPMLVLR